MAAPVKPITRTWKGDSTGDIIPEVAPPARLEYLVGLASIATAGATTPYASTCIVMDPSVSKEDLYWRYALPIAAGSQSMRGIFGRSWTPGGSTPAGNTLAYSETSGTGANDLIQVAFGEMGTNTFPAAAYLSAVVASSETYEASPSASMDRVFELTPALSPSIERFRARRCCSASGEVRQVLDLASL